MLRSDRVLHSRTANLVILTFLAIAIVDIATGLEHWPFGSYPMYSLLYGKDLAYLRLYGLRDGEIELRRDADFAPFDQPRLTMALSRIRSSDPSGRSLKQALAGLLDLYNRQHPTPLLGIRLYEVNLTLKPDSPGSRNRQTRVLIAEAGSHP